MLEPYEMKIITGYLQKLVDEHCCNGELLFSICRILTKNENRFSVPLDNVTLQIIEENDKDDLVVRRQLCQRLYTGVSKALKKMSVVDTSKEISILQKNINSLVEALNINELEANILGLLSRYYLCGPVQGICDELTHNHIDALTMCAAMLGVDKEDFRESLQRGRMVELGVVDLCSSARLRDIDDNWSVTDKIRSAIAKAKGTKEDLCRMILGTAPSQPTLEWSDFDHLDAVPDHLKRFLQGVLRQQVKGINILLYGRPGTGKTEFCKTLADSLGVNLYSIGEMDDDGAEATRGERLGYMRIAQGVLSGGTPCILLLDEMDDVLAVNGSGTFGESRKGSKIYFNRLLENNQIPVLWTINNIELLEEATLRRMSAVVEIKSPPESRRREVWERVMKKQSIALPQEEIDALAELQLSPAMVANAARFSQIAGGGVKDFRFAAEGVTRAIHGGRLPGNSDSKEIFLPSLTNADFDLDELIQNLRKAPTRAFSLCLFGPPGTGKSAFVRHLAECLEMPILFKRASDLISKYVGDSEKQIAAAFAEARDRGAFLIFDEADSLLGDRQYAQQSWEVSQVNEMLTWMERHPLPFACTTNLKERLDPASLRRFTFKSCFDYLRPEQVSLAFEHFFAKSLHAGEAHDIGLVTPGDFAVVRQKSRIFGMQESSRLVELLKQEVTCREVRPSKSKQIGFAAPSQTIT
jgi:SpoVK/Ycf46/Vps4 family AAA+-type ATPase